MWLGYLKNVPLTLVLVCKYIDTLILRVQFRTSAFCKLRTFPKLLPRFFPSHRPIPKGGMGRCDGKNIVKNKVRKKSSIVYFSTK